MPRNASSILRKHLCLISALLLSLSVLFMLLIHIGNVGNSWNRPLIKKGYLIKLDFSRVIPESVPHATRIDDILHNFGLRNFYQTGLWNYCAGNNNQGVVYCSPSKLSYWFNPVGVLQHQILAGSKINFPDNIKRMMYDVRLASKWMLSLFLTSICLATILIPICISSGHNRSIAGLGCLMTLFNAAFALAASTIATVMFVVMHNKFEEATEINVKADIGWPMFAIMWTASLLAIDAFVLQSYYCYFGPTRSEGNETTERRKRRDLE